MVTQCFPQKDQHCEHFYNMLNGYCQGIKPDVNLKPPHPPGKQQEPKHCLCALQLNRNNIKIFFLCF